MIIIHDTYLYAPVDKCRRNSRMFDCIRKLRFDRSYSKRCSRYDPPRIGAYRRRDSRLCRRICSRRRRSTRTARWRGIEKDSSSNPIVRIDRPLNCILDCKYIRNASWWDGRCIVRSLRIRNYRCTHLKGKKITRENVSFAHISYSYNYNLQRGKKTCRILLSPERIISLTDLIRSSMIMFLDSHDAKRKGDMHASEVADRKKKVAFQSASCAGRVKQKLKKKIRIMKAPIGLHVVPSPSYPGLHTHFANGSSCWQDALGSQMSTSKQDISARRKKIVTFYYCQHNPPHSFYNSDFSSGKILWNAKALESSLSVSRNKRL